MKALSPIPEAVRQAFVLGKSHLAVTQRYAMESRLMMHAPDGSINSTDVYRLTVACAPQRSAGTEGDRCTCLKFTVQLGGAPEAVIPSLEGWSYTYRHVAGAADTDGRTLGIPHQPFEKLVDQDGAVLPAGNAYHVYNAFIDFHSFFFFAQRNELGPGIQDLSSIGTRIIRAAAGATAATDVKGVTGKESHFTNGEITLELKGLGLVNEASCAIVGFDSGSSSFLMVMKAAENREVRTVGSSHYHGDIYLDIDTGWIQKAGLTEMVVSETTVPGDASRIHGVAERTIELRAIPVETAMRDVFAT